MTAEDYFFLNRNLKSRYFKPHVGKFKKQCILQIIVMIIDTNINNYALFKSLSVNV